MKRPTARGFTLLEVLVAIGIIALVSSLIYGAFHGMTRSRDNLRNAADRYQQGRAALTRMSHELGSAFVSGHVPLDQNLIASQTVFIGADRANGDRVDFTAFAHRRLSRDSHESDQAEISFFLAPRPNGDGLDLVRRSDKYIDTEPQQGGIVEVLAENVESFEVRYLDPLTNEWLDTWDTTQPAAQLGRLPQLVWITLVLNGGPAGPVRFETKAPISIQMPLMWAIQ